MEENKRERWKKAVLPERDTKMRFYLNSRAPYVLYEGETKSRYFIDKTLMLEKIFGFIEEEVDGLYEKYLADTVRIRRLEGMISRSGMTGIIRKVENVFIIQDRLSWHYQIIIWGIIGQILVHMMRSKG